jgi:hypothetical protein
MVEFEGEFAALFARDPVVHKTMEHCHWAQDAKNEK